MGYYEKRKKRIWIYLLILVGLVYYNINGPVYECSKVNKNSEWYVNDIYMSTQYYYDNLLNEEEKILYKSLFQNLNNMEDGFYLNAPYSVVGKVWDALICDHPEMINLKTFSYVENGETTRIYPKYLTNSEFILKLKQRSIQRKIGKVVEETKGMSEYEREKYVYEWLGKKSSYGNTSNNSDQSAYTAFTTLNNTVYAGYAKAAQILMSNVDVNSIININEDHMWNTVKLDGEYYFFDATLTSNTRETYEGNVSHMGLNQNKNTSNYNIIYPYLLPDVAGEKYNYYDYESLTLTYSEDKIDIIRTILKNSEYRRVEIKFTNPEEAESEINSKYLDYLDLRSLETYYNSDGYCKGNGVIMFVKNT